MTLTKTVCMWHIMRISVFTFFRMIHKLNGFDALFPFPPEKHEFF